MFEDKALHQDPGEPPELKPNNACAEKETVAICLYSWLNKNKN